MGLSKNKVYYLVVAVASLTSMMGCLSVLADADALENTTQAVEISPTAMPKPTETPELTEFPVPTVVPKLTEIPKPTEEPKTTEAPVPTNEPEPSKIKVFAGNEKFEKNNRIDIQGKVLLNGHINGNIKCHNMESLYQAYNLTEKDDHKVLFDKIREDKNRLVLEETFKKSKEEDLKYDIQFVIKGDNSGITGIYITGKSLILELDGERKLFISNRIKDSGAVTDEGEPFGGYIPITK